jgi:ATP-binding cassette, subfamily B, multidrug efflux pump
MQPPNPSWLEEEALGKAYDSRLMARLLRYLRPYRGWVVVSVLLLMVHSLLSVAGPYLTKIAIDLYLNPEDGAASPFDAWLPAGALAGLNVLALAYVSVLGLGFVFRYLQTYLMNYTGQRVMCDLRLEILGHLQKMGLRFYDRNPVGRLVTRVTNDVDVLNEMFSSGVVAIFGDLLTFIFILATMFHLSPPLTLVTLAVTPLVLLVTLLFRRKARQSYRQVRTAIAKINSFLQEHFSGVAVVQLFHHESRSGSQFDAINAEHRDAQRDAIRAHAWFFPVIEWLGVLTIAALLVYGGRQVDQGVVSLGVLVAFLQYANRLFRPLQDLSEKYSILQAAMASCERIFRLLDMPADEERDRAESAAAGGGAAVFAVEGALRVEFQNVWFAYKDEDWVLRDVSFTAEPGETLAIVGHTGAGKTTIVSLLLRFYEVRRGRILVGGRDIRQWPLQTLRRQFGVVLQDPYLFTGTIESNIRLGNGGVPRDRVEQVIREVNLEGFIGSRPKGLAEELREHGDSLSWGQKQLVSFARALARQPRILILDEATSSVDTETENKIREAVPRLMAGHTSIVIAHRLSTIKRAGRILVMHKGKIREVGNHQQLLAQRGIYWKLYQLQYREQEAEPAARPADTASSNGPGASASAAIASQQDLPFDLSPRPDAESAS